MADTWYTDITHFLDEDGNLVADPPAARRLGEYLTAIILMASFPAPEYPPEYAVTCRRRPKKKPCRGGIVAFVDPETDDIAWICPKCQERGFISRWRGTIWDMSEYGEFVH